MTHFPFPVGWRHGRSDVSTVTDYVFVLGSCGLFSAFFQFYQNTYEIQAAMYVINNIGAFLRN